MQSVLQRELVKAKLYNRMAPTAIPAATEQRSNTSIVQQPEKVRL